MVNDPAIAVRMAARALGRAGLVHAYGHCSARLDDDSFLVCPPRPMGLILPGEPCTTVPVSGALPAGVLGEVRLHQKIYAARPAAGAVIRFMSPSVMALAALGLRPQMRHGFGTYFAPQVGFWDDIQLIRDDARASGVVDAMGESAGVLMRGNGAVVSGGSIEEALMLAWYLEDMCRIELAALSAGNAASAPVVSAADAAVRATFGGGIVERMWEYLTAGDPERNS
ncbi:HCOMODA/2-hydroxy-3-carboxy-muconic semialdehyde decarboxylase [Ochrobactrum daejeonense]|uniref:HCOMODA/2-hydroxy-3-carboxy-muconic semialdehyde decarboxylase n=1 Tax=Brucella daejeonensis TaxID=659015 RepID=A0A7W9EL92_9HYPH|nr:class II aldolase/adducin family protein [Brucella daejeonensis]MBB5702104.1 HCOMODA/2-hydroxy-3-carboxy-muconic semialdehyde decarboxylase [Brucella daejeonensis]NKB80034.1 class II aldolase/adducin family protein [Brucella daejeonensis]